MSELDSRASEWSSWEVTLAISGPITVEVPLNMNVQKGQEQPFWTTLKVTKAPQGVKAEIVAKAINQTDASDAAIFFVGQALDVLALHIGLPLYVGSLKGYHHVGDTHVKKLVSEQEWLDSFRLGREYGANQAVLSRALSWFRKGLISEDPIDKFLAFWSSIESIGSACVRKTERTNLGAVNQICDCFDQLWGDVANWKVIPSRAVCVNDFHEIRNGIAHGYMSVDVETVRRISHDLDVIQSLATAFLSDWERKITDDN
jgi:hypothetical protein